MKALQAAHEAPFWLKLQSLNSTGAQAQCFFSMSWKVAMLMYCVCGYVFKVYFVIANCVIL